MLAPAVAAVIGAALVIAVFGPKAGPPEAAKAPHVVAFSQGPSEAPQASGETVAAQGDVDEARLKDAAAISIVPSVVQPRELDPDASPAAAPSPSGVAQPAPGTDPGPPAAAPVAPAAAAEPAAPLAASQSPDLSPVGAVSTRAGATAPPAVNAVAASVAPAAAAEPAAPLAASQSPDLSPVNAVSTRADAAALSAAGGAARPDGPERPAKAAPPAESKVVAVAPPPTLRLALPTTLFRRASMRARRAQISATTPVASVETRRQPQRSEAPATAAAPAESPATSAPAAGSAPVNPVSQAFGALTGATGQAAKAGDWALQFAAPKSEAEAETAAQRLNAKYASALNGAMIGVHKTQVDGGTIYTLRVPGLSKAEAAALCVRLKGRDCNIAK
jgi:hypothetical protein